MFIKACIVLVTLCVSVQLANGGTTKKKADDLPRKDPGRNHEVSNRYGVEEVPEECKKLNYCTIKPSDYPQEEFNQMFKGHKPAVEPSLVLEETSIDNRMGDPDERDDCDSDVTYEPLYKVRTTHGDWRTVVQAPDEDYIQRIRLETCLNPGGSCFTQYPVPVFETLCKQKFNTWEVLVASGNNKTEKIKTELPTCCSCYYRGMLQEK